MDEITLSLESVRSQLRELPPSGSREIALSSGLAYDTIRRIARGSQKDVRLSTLKKIAQALAGRGAGASTAIRVEQTRGEMPVPAEARS